MCQKKSYCNREIDECIRKSVEEINNDKFERFQTRLSCCGHGKYTKTIIVKNKRSQHVFEWFSGIPLENYYRNGKLRKKWYKKDEEGYYYLPEVEYLESFISNQIWIYNGGEIGEEL
jgi:hypothetical protein